MSFGYRGRALSPPVRAMLRAASRVPPPAMRQMLRLTPLFIRLVGRPDRRQRDFMLGLVPRVNVRQCAWGAGAVLGWAYRGEPPAPVYHIHGGIDRIVPVQNVRPDVVLPTAGHALNVTHAGIVNALLARQMGVGGK
jgi:pimeloyl-ACP methyl ester carboxylesterase